MNKDLQFNLILPKINLYFFHYQIPKSFNDGVSEFPSLTHINVTLYKLNKLLYIADNTYKVFILYFSLFYVFF